ncbi:MAG TPA: PilZ domain-containing protein [Candidatus Elarobacter sp.]|jgi:hypothetical protein|nr:PilZ domain-containing protein [Candidatus Elarobacter sp.]
MLNEFVKRLGSGKADRRGAARVRKRYTVSWEQDGKSIPSRGLEISEKGLLFATQELPVGRHLDVTIDVAPKPVRARLRIVRHGPVEREGVRWNLVATVFEAIAADDWDVVVRFCRNRGTPANKAAQELMARAGDDDAYRLLPLRVQERVVAALVAAGRLAPSDAKNPLLRITSCVTKSNGTFEVELHSRRVDDGDVLSFDSILSIDDAGNVRLKQ